MNLGSSMVEKSTFRSRVLQLLQRSRRALRLYSSVSQVGIEGSREFAELQATEWRMTNTFLVREISTLLDEPTNRELAIGLRVLADRLEDEGLSAEGEMHAKQCALVFSAENGDYVRSAVLGKELVILKARMQARQAANHEVNGVLKSARVTPQPELIAQPREIELDSKVIEESNFEPASNVIPLRRRL